MSIRTTTVAIILFLTILGCKQSNLEILQQAELLSQKGNYDKAIDLCNRVLASDSTVQLAYFNRGICYMNTKDYTQAISDFDKIILLQPQESGFRFRVNRDSPFGSEEDKLKIFFEEALFQKATTEYLAGNVSSSLRDFSMCLENGYQPQSKCYLWLGTIYARLGNKSKGCEMYTKAIMLGDVEGNELRDKICK